MIAHTLLFYSSVEFVTTCNTKRIIAEAAHHSVAHTECKKNRNICKDIVLY